MKNGPFRNLFFCYIFYMTKPIDKKNVWCHHISLTKDWKKKKYRVWQFSLNTQKISGVDYPVRFWKFCPLCGSSRPRWLSRRFDGANIWFTKKNPWLTKCNVGILIPRDREKWLGSIQRALGKRARCVWRRGRSGRTEFGRRGKLSDGVSIKKKPAIFALIPKRVEAWRVCWFNYSKNASPPQAAVDLEN